MHKFHIPVLGLGFSIDTPLKVARYGITSTVSIVDDELIERMRQHHCKLNYKPFTPINKADADSRSRRITAYLDLLQDLVDEQIRVLKKQPFYLGRDVDRYFNLLPDTDSFKQGFELLPEFEGTERGQIFENILRASIKPGAIEVNIMSKVDKLNVDSTGNNTGDLNSDALAALRGFAESKLQSAVILSAGLNQRLYNYLEHFTDFFPDERARFRKKIILKVSDFRSAQVQAKLLAKKGLWVSEFRIESGLNCGGHAFATDGLLMGPILEEFKQKRYQLKTELFEIYQSALQAKGYNAMLPEQRISAQGGIGTAEEQRFLLDHYQLDGVGWGSPFLLVPEATNVDNDTLKDLVTATKDDYYVSNASPLGVLFNNFRKSTMERQRLKRIALGRPGSPCTKKFLVNNTEFTDSPICTASRQYQSLKIKQLKTLDLSDGALKQSIDEVTQKICLCEGLCASAYIKNNILRPHESTGVAICPGPNLANFSRTYTLDEMTGHIYGKNDLLADVKRKHVFINELELYINYLFKLIAHAATEAETKQQRYIQKFTNQLLEGIGYYKTLFTSIRQFSLEDLSCITNELKIAEVRITTGIIQ